ncbi:permease prefix domain 1-containing protein [Terrilactibacillus sp. S3-3]|nr:permease prefix domain 1-containing protein [Terrilactibacillus sp. S3-3]
MNNYVRSHGNLKETDILELENHLRDEIEDLTKAGLTQDESFLIGVKRLGNVSAISEEYSKVNTENLWKQLLNDPENSAAIGRDRKEIAWVIIFSLIAGTLMEVPELFGFKLFNPADQLLYFKNLGPFILPFVAAFFLIKHQSGWKRAAVIIGIFCLSAIVINLYPSRSPNTTELLTGIHLPIFLWLVTGAAYLGTEWRKSRRRMDFIRFTGEAFIYGVLIFCGIIVLSLFTLAIFSAIQIDLSSFIQQYLVVYGGSATAMIAICLAETKKKRC